MNGSESQRFKKSPSGGNAASDGGAVKVWEPQSGGVGSARPQEGGQLQGVGCCMDCVREGGWEMASYSSSEVNEVSLSSGISKPSVKGQMVNLLSFVGHTVSVATA